MSAYLILQLADSAYPYGEFAHSSGLESLSKWNEVYDTDSLERFVHDNVLQSAHGQLPFVNAAHCGEAYDKIDQRCNVFMTNHVANRASRRQGKAFLATSERAFYRAELGELKYEVDSKKLPGHFAPTFGITCAIMGISRRVTARVFLYMTLRGLISSAIRLNLVGPLQGQSLLFKFSSYTENLADRFAAENRDAAQTSPVIEIFQATHDRLYSKLFQS